MTKRRFRFLSGWIRRSSFLAAILVAGTMATARPIGGQQIQLLVLAPIQGGVGHAIEMLLANVGKKPVTLRVDFLRAADLFPVGTSGITVVGIGTGDHISIPPLNDPILPVVQFIDGAPGSLRLSIQGFDGAGQPKAFGGLPWFGFK